MRVIERKTYKGATEVSVQPTEVEFCQARLASDLMKNLSIVACVPDGVDLAGRSKLRLMTEIEVVERATKIADLAWTEYRKRGWLLDVPAPKMGEDDE